MIAASDFGVVPQSIWDVIIKALTAATRETDVLGWFEGRSTLGVVLPEIQAFTELNARDLETRVRVELAQRLDAETYGKCSIRLHVHAPGCAGGSAHRATGPRLRAELTARHGDGGFYTFIKRTLDVIGSLLLLATLSPFYWLIAAVVKLTSPGPALVKEARIGHAMKPFAMLRYRTMKVDAAHRHHAVGGRFSTPGGRLPERRQGRSVTFGNEPQLTPVGSILRKTGLDELPQLWNVLRGEMSLVGPRPPFPDELEQYRPWHFRRVLEAKPGMTGLWQVSGRSHTTFDEMVRLDLRYARARSLWTDITILLATPAAVISRNGAC